MDIFDGFVPSDNILSSLNIDSIDLSGSQMWSGPSTRPHESEFNHNGLSCISDIPITNNSVHNTSSFGIENGGSFENPQSLVDFNSTYFPTSFSKEYQPDDDILKWVCDTGLESVLNEDPSSYNSTLIEGFGMNSGYRRNEGSLEDMIMAPLVDNKNIGSFGCVLEVEGCSSSAKNGLFSRLGLDQLLSNKGQLFSANCYAPIGKSTTISDARSCITGQSVRGEESLKGAKKRARPGQSTRPRPKDRQMIQDRIKELREIIPNGAKCSIDSLLDRAIKHMLFMQGVTNYGDKLKQVHEIKAQRDNANGEISGSAAWAVDVGGQNPVLVEDIGNSGQMLIEMLCKEQGFFLEIADVVRSFGLTILKGVVEARGDNIWAHFIVEANRHVTRMQVLMSLLQLLQDTSTSPLPLKTIVDENNYHHHPMMSHQSIA